MKTSILALLACIAAAAYALPIDDATAIQAKRADSTVDIVFDTWCGNPRVSCL
ncbi:hypothetical protein PLEOSDRAFT_1088268 [Pleurotus ostreatus PC15]|uniref:Small secreted protein n=1 Tax=Pleurotus ostreatus (strain PC15) TaxID=1137138 RepID=A0A067NSJ9_PLEO1|nr:hypothetical protein PLEOSDRAFT_1088268 [Pleurotus ostreatus PC15]